MVAGRHCWGQATLAGRDRLSAGSKCLCTILGGNPATRGLSQSRQVKALCGGQLVGGACHMWVPFLPAGSHISQILHCSRTLGSQKMLPPLEARLTYRREMGWAPWSNETSRAEKPPRMKNNWNLHPLLLPVSYQDKHTFTLWSSFSTLWLNFPKRNNTPTHRYLHKNIQSSSIHNRQLETTQMPVNRIDNSWYIYTIEYYSAIKRNEQMLDTAKLVNLKNFMLIKRSFRTTPVVHGNWILAQLRLWAPNAEGPGFISGMGTGSHLTPNWVHMSQLKILHTARNIRDTMCCN